MTFHQRFELNSNFEMGVKQFSAHKYINLAHLNTPL